MKYTVILKGQLIEEIFSGEHTNAMYDVEAASRQDAVRQAVNNLKGDHCIDGILKKSVTAVAFPEFDWIKYDLDAEEVV